MAGEEDMLVDAWTRNRLQRAVHEAKNVAKRCTISVDGGGVLSKPVRVDLERAAARQVVLRYGG